MVKELLSVSEWQSETGRGVVIVDISAKWCGPCRNIAPVFDALAQEYGARVVKLDVDNDALGDVISTLNVRALPTFKVMKDGLVMDGDGWTVVGADVSKLRDLVARAAAL